MSKLIFNMEYQLYELKGLAYYSTRQVADEFTKRHADVLRAYDEMVATANSDEPTQLNSEGDSGSIVQRKIASNSDDEEVTLEFLKQNFFEHKYIAENGKKAREVMMTEDGASILIMGFTGKKALSFKVKLMKRFRMMEQFIMTLQNARLEHPAFTQAIMDAHEEPKHYHFSNEADMINRIVLGMSAKQFRKVHNLEKNESIRPYLANEQIKAVEALQRADIGLLISIPDYQDRKSRLAAYFERMKLKYIA